MFIAITMARAGSKRLPGKNTKPLGNRPLCVYTFELMRKSDRLAECYSFSDDAVFNSIANTYSISTEFHRSDAVSGDSCSSDETLASFVSQYLNSNKTINLVDTHIVLLQPTSPLRDIGLLNKALNLYEKVKPDCLVSGYLRHNKFHRNGAIYIISLERFIKSQKITPGQPLEFIMSEEQSVDIDTHDDFKLAEKILLGIEHGTSHR